VCFRNNSGGAETHKTRLSSTAPAAVHDECEDDEAVLLGYSIETKVRDRWSNRNESVENVARCALSTAPGAADPYSFEDHCAAAVVRATRRVAVRGAARIRSTLSRLRRQCIYLQPTLTTKKMLWIHCSPMATYRTNTTGRRSAKIVEAQQLMSHWLSVSADMLSVHLLSAPKDQL
jgi:hypothetical protein